MLLIGAETHDLFDPGAVVPRTVEKYDLPRRGQLHDVALEIPLPALTLGRDGERDDPRVAGIQVFHESFDGTAFTRRVAALKDDDNAVARILNPVLQLEQLHLQQPLLVIV